MPGTVDIRKVIEQPLSPSVMRVALGAFHTRQLMQEAFEHYAQRAYHSLAVPRELLDGPGCSYARDTADAMAYAALCHRRMGEPFEAEYQNEPGQVVESCHYEPSGPSTCCAELPPPVPVRITIDEASWAGITEEAWRRMARACGDDRAAAELYGLPQPAPPEPLPGPAVRKRRTIRYLVAREQPTPAWLLDVLGPGYVIVARALTADGDVVTAEHPEKGRHVVRLSPPPTFTPRRCRRLRRSSW